MEITPPILAQSRPRGRQAAAPRPPPHPPRPRGRPRKDPAAIQPGARTQRIILVLTVELLARIEAYRRTARARNAKGGISIPSRSDVVRDSLDRQLPPLTETDRRALAAMTRAR